MRTLSMLVAIAVIAGCGTPPTPPPIEEEHSDAGMDAGSPDAGAPDSGEPDAGEPDAGEPDAGSPLTDFTLQGIRLGDAGGIGKRIRAIVERESDGARVGTLDQVISSVAETFRIPGIIADGESYTVRLYIDLDGNLQCDPPPPDGLDFGYQQTGLLGAWNGLELYFHTSWEPVDVCSSFP